MRLISNLIVTISMTLTLVVTGCALLEPYETRREVPATQPGEQPTTIIVKNPPPIEGTEWDVIAMTLGGGIAVGVLEGIRRWNKARIAAKDQEIAQKDKAIEQIVTGVEKVLPEKSELQKLKLAAAQDESTKKLVEEIKTGKSPVSTK